MSHEFTLPAKTVHLTISIGVACCSRFDQLDSQQVIHLADNALYRAKRGGKNQACFADENELSVEEVRNLSKGETGLTQAAISQSSA